MTNTEIKKYIDLLNNGKHKEIIFTRKIGENVDLAKVWTEQPTKDDNICYNSCSRTFFFIKNEDNKYIGAVLDMNKDLHWYILPEDRKKGYLSISLNHIILPYIFINYREIQRVTIKENEVGSINYVNSLKIILKTGFKPTNKEETEFELKKSNFNIKKNKIKEVNAEISFERIDELNKELFFANKLLSKVSDELLMTIGDDKNLNEITRQIKDKIYSLDNLKFKDMFYNKK